MATSDIILILLLLLDADTGIGKKLEVDSGESPNADAAKAQLQKIQKQTEHMRYGKCWMEALEVLQNGCRRLTDETQRRIAYAFARCHLESSGRHIPECPDEKPMSQCTDSDSLPDIAFNTYTEFFTHTQQICFHLQNQAWHEATENTISRLADNSAEVAAHLEESSAVAQEMIARQNRSLKNQEILIENEERLKVSMMQSVLDVKKSHDETKKIISEQRALFSEVFDRVAVLQKTVLGEFSSIYTFGFYVGSTLLAYILTSTTRTSGARIWLFLILLVNAIVERLITQYYVNAVDNSTSFADGKLGAFIPELIYEQTWLCRQVFSGLALLVLFISACRYKDYNKMNNTLLNEIKKQNQELQSYIRENIHDVTHGIVATSHTQSSATVVKDENGIHNEAIGKQMLLEKHQSDVATLSHNETGVNVSLTDANSTIRPVDVSGNPIDLTDSDNDSDATFRHSEIIRDDSDASSIITVSSRRSTQSVTARIRQRSSTPMRQSPLTHEDSSHSAVALRRTRRKSSIIATLDDSVSFVEPPAESVSVGGYCLRRRPGTPLVNNAILQHETVEEFTSYVMHNLAAKSAAKRNRIQQHLAKTYKKST